MHKIILNGLALVICVMSQVCGLSQSDSKHVSQEIEVGGRCDRCELIFEGIPSLEKITMETTIAGPTEPGERMEISGLVLKSDSKTPASNVVIYLYHTNAKGLYQPGQNQTLGKAHGQLRGWLKTNENGEFKFHSIRPVPYPGEKIPAHIHFLIKEQGKKVYYIDELWFDDDKFLTNNLRNRAEKQGGDMIITLSKNTNNIWTGNAKITLGLNIPGYK